MTECLGIHFENNIVKYAKLSYINKSVELKEHGIRPYKLNKDSVVLDIIEETNSKNIPIVINSTDNTYVNFQIIDNNSKKSYTNEILNTEFEAWCEKNAKSPEKFLYTYLMSNQKDKTHKCNGILDISKKEVLDEELKNGVYKISGIYDSDILVNNIIDEEKNKNYILLNINKDIIATTVIDGKIIETRVLGSGVNEIIERYKAKFESYQKAYEACKKINVYEENDSNDKELEEVAEPILQDVIKNISTFVTKYKMNIDKIFLSGNITLFNNIDLLLKEYFDLKCEILLPKMVHKEEKNITEIVEIIPAISIAYEHLVGNGSKNFLSKDKNKLKFDSESFKNISKLSVAVSIVTVLFIVYISFGIVYRSMVDGMVEETNASILEIDENINRINEDIKYISENKEEYQKVNTQVDEILDNKDGNGSTYNVAAFLQNIMRIIPENVKLNSISSDDNKNIKIIAESDSYSNLGYFISELKLEGTLNNITINDVKNGNITTVEIGGELP